MKAKLNYDSEELYCIECKKRIEIGEKYIIVEEKIYGEQIVIKCYHPDCVPTEEDEIYIGEQ